MVYKRMGDVVLLCLICECFPCSVGAVWGFTSGGSAAVPQASHALCSVPAEPAGRRCGKLAEEKPASSCQPASGARHGREEGWGCRSCFNGILPKHLIWKRWEVLAAQLRSAHRFDARRVLQKVVAVTQRKGCFEPLRGKYHVEAHCSLLLPKRRSFTFGCSVNYLYTEDVRMQIFLC